MRSVKLYQSCTGINNKVDAARLPFDPDAGLTDIEAGSNVLIDKTGGLSAMRGTSLSLSGSYHSGFPLSDYSFLAVKDRATDSAIYLVTVQVDGSLSEEGLVSGLALGAPVEFCRVAKQIFYENGFQHGYIEDGAAYSWPVSEWPRTTNAQFVATPAGTHFDIHAGHFVLAVGDELVFTELWLWGLIDNARNWRKFESQITMVCSVGTGAFVSDQSAVYFLQGADPAKWEPKKVFNYPAVPFCKHPGLVDPTFFGFETAVPAALFGTVKGPVIGLADGVAFNLIDKKVAMNATGQNGSIMVVDETTIIQSGV